MFGCCKIWAKEMEELEREYLISYYDRRVGLLGKTPAALGWSEKGQLTRYEAALGLFNFDFDGLHPGKCKRNKNKNSSPEGASLVDYGCGMGDFYGFLLGKGISGIHYYGFDINPGLISIAQARYMEKSGGRGFFSFGVLDIDTGELPGSYDYSLICGVFNQRMDGVLDSAKRCIEKVWSRTKKALVFDALSGGKDWRGKEKDAWLQYHDPEEMLEFAKKIPGAAASLHEDLVEDGFILHLRRD